MLIDGGYIKLFRQIVNWEWYNDSQTLHLFLHLILKANHQENSWQGQTIQRGQLITGRLKLSKETGISQRSIRTCLRRLKATNEITTKTTSRFSLITIVNYEYYQSDTNKATNKTTNKQSNERPTIDQQSTTNKNDKNDKNDKDNICTPVFIKPSPQEVNEYTKSIGFILDAEYFIDYYETRGWIVGKNKMKDWKAAIRNWKKNNFNHGGNNATNQQSKPRGSIDYKKYAEERAASHGEETEARMVVAGIPKQLL
jgi:hypothetical protein